MGYHAQVEMDFHMVDDMSRTQKYLDLMVADQAMALPSKDEDGDDADKKDPLTCYVETKANIGIKALQDALSDDILEIAGGRCKGLVVVKPGKVPGLK